MLHIYGNYHSSLNSYDKEQQTSRSNHQLYRYNHEPVSSNLLRRDIPPILILLFFLFLIVITLSQILVVHTSRYGANFSTMQKIQEELKLMDDSMEALLRDNVLPIDKWRLLFHIQTYLYRFESLFDLFNNDSNLITNQSLSQTITNINIKQLLKPLLNKSNEFLLRENTSDYLMNNIKHVQDRLKTMINEKDYSEWKRRRTKNNYKRQRKYCPEEPRYLRGRFLDENSTFPNISLYEIETNYSHIRSGGQWSPSHCLARHRVAIIIPYRDRFEHLVTLLYYLHPILQRQELDYKIYVSEQAGNGTYNKAVLMNAAFIYASSEYDFQCFVFHDVDLIPEDDRNMYSCPIFPRHMSVAIDEMNYKLTYEELIGGVLNIRTDHFLTVNGYSNLYWGWGAEDDDLYYRLKEVSLKLIRPPATIARYKMLQHTKRVPSIWNKRAKLLYSAAKRYTWDGVSSARYNLTSVISYPLFTHLIIDVGFPPPGFS
jgi:beta-1,4-galactosyltransferase 1